MKMLIGRLPCGRTNRINPYNMTVSAVAVKADPDSGNKYCSDKAVE